MPNARSSGAAGDTPGALESPLARELDVARVQFTRTILRCDSAAALTEFRPVGYRQIIESLKFAEWCKAHQVVDSWLRFSLAYELALSRVEGASDAPWLTPVVTARDVGPDPYRESQGQFLDRMTRLYQGVSAAALASGARRRSKKTATPQHLEWLARWLVDRKSFDSIAEAVPYLTSGGKAVRVATHRAAAWLGVTLPTLPDA